AAVRRIVGAGAISIMLLTACQPALAVAKIAPFAAADDAVLRGCYDCLRDARQHYTRLATGSDRPRATQGLFESNLLIALREKELGLPPTEALAEARRIAALLPPDLDDALPSDALDTAFYKLQLRTAQTPDAAPRREWLSRGRIGKTTRDYLQIALDCQ